MTDTIENTPQATSKSRTIQITIILVALSLLAGFFVISSNKSEVGIEPVSIYNPKGQLVIPAQFSDPWFFNNGMSQYSTRSSDTPLFTGGGNSGSPLKLNLTEDLHGLISAKGKISLPMYRQIGEFEEGIAPASIEEDRYGAVDVDGKWVIQPKYYWITNFNNGLAAFMPNKGSKYGYINTKGEVVVKPTYDSASQFSEQRAMVCNKVIEGISQNCGFIDTSGKLQTKMEYSSFNSHAFSEGYAMVCKGYEKNTKCGYIDLNGSVVHPIEYSAVQSEYGTWSSPFGDFVGGYAIYGGYWYDGIQKWGLINREFKTQIESIFTAELSKFSNDPWDFDAGIQWQTVGKTKDNPGRSAAVDTQGNILFYSNYDEIQAFSNGVSAVKVGSKWGFINQKNEMVVKPQFDEVRDYSEGLAAVRLNGFWGYIN